MSRLATCGFEVGAPSSMDLSGEGQGISTSFSGTTSLDTTNPRSGARALSLATSSGASSYVYWPIGTSAGRDYFLRTYLRMSALLANAVEVMVFQGAVIRVRLNTDGTLTVINAANNQVGSASASLSTNTWYRVELRVRYDGPTTSDGTFELRLDGSTVASGAVGVGGIGGSPSSPTVGIWNSVTTAATLLFDDVAFNDDQGTDQNSWPGEGKIVLARPTGDNANVGWKGGANGTMNLYDGVDNAPPSGLSQGSALDTSQIKNTNNNTTDAYDANLQGYDSLGITGDDTITLVQPLVNQGQGSTTAISLGQQLLSNPAISETTANGPGSAVSTYPTGWTTNRGNIAYSPTVTKTTSPVMRIRAATASTVNHHVDLMGAYVEFVRVPPPTPPTQPVVINTAVSRASSF